MLSRKRSFILKNSGPFTWFRTLLVVVFLCAFVIAPVFVFQSVQIEHPRTSLETGLTAASSADDSTDDRRDSGYLANLLLEEDGGDGGVCFVAEPIDPFEFPISLQTRRFPRLSISLLISFYQKQFKPHILPA